MADISMGDEPSSIEKTVKLQGPMKGVAAIVIVAVVLVGLYFLTKKEEASPEQAPTPAATTGELPTPSSDTSSDETMLDAQGNPVSASASDTVTGTPPPVAVSGSEYKDGTYTAVGSYTSPGGPEKVGITLTLKGDMVTDASAKVMAELPTSVKFQTLFANNFKAMIVGKKLDDVTLDKVSGSSLTPGGFNDAVVQIKTQAKAN